MMCHHDVNDVITIIVLCDVVAWLLLLLLLLLLLVLQLMVWRVGSNHAG